MPRLFQLSSRRRGSRRNGQESSELMSTVTFRLLKAISEEKKAIHEAKKEKERRIKVEHEELFAEEIKVANRWIEEELTPAIRVAVQEGKTSLNVSALCQESKTLADLKEKECLIDVPLQVVRLLRKSPYLKCADVQVVQSEGCCFCREYSLRW